MDARRASGIQEKCVKMRYKARGYAARKGGELRAVRMAEMGPGASQFSEMMRRCSIVGRGSVEIGGVGGRPERRPRRGRRIWEGV